MSGPDTPKADDRTSEEILASIHQRMADLRREAATYTTAALIYQSDGSVRIITAFGSQTIRPIEPGKFKTLFARPELLP